MKNRQIKKTNVINFSADTKKKIKIADKVHEIRMQRDLFGILGLSMNYRWTRIDLKRILLFITPIPMSMCQLDGSIRKTNKSIITKILEKKLIVIHQILLIL